jgi:hypothetical protein
MFVDRNARVSISSRSLGGAYRGCGGEGEGTGLEVHGGMETRGVGFACTR